MLSSGPKKVSILGAPRLWNIVFIWTLLVYAAGLSIDIMEPDAAVYAEISMEMHDSGNWLNIFHKGKDWLDKPHFPFWMTALSYKIFGVNTFSYKLPGILFVLLGAWYVFLFAKKFYSARHGYIAALLLLTAEHIIISNQDVRAEPYMTGLTIMSLYHFALYLLAVRPSFAGNIAARLPAATGPGKWFHALAGSLALSCLIMTKGLFTIIPVAGGIGLSLLFAGRWKTIFHWQWLAIGSLVLIGLFPSLYGYYLQFDLHPEKEIFGQQNVSGVEFFLWTSQWGRFTNTGPITGKGDLFFFVHTLLWAFLPWAFLAFFALFRKTKELIRGVSATENYTYFGFISLFIIFSLSRFQLSFYLNPLFPLLAILTTVVLLKQKTKTLRTFAIMHGVLCGLLLAALGLLHFFFSGSMPHIDTLVILLTGSGIGFYLFTRKGKYLKKIVFATALITLSVNYYVNRDFYPALLTYQSESQVGYYVKENGIPAKDLVIIGDVQSVADIILRQVTPVYPFADLGVEELEGKYVYTDQTGLQKIDSIGKPYQLLKVFDDFHVTMLTGKFINRKTREAAVDKKYLLKIE